jgi:hypothetical protein
VSVDELERAFSIAQNINYYAVAEQGPSENPMPNDLTEDEKKCIRDEREHVFSQPGMPIIIITVSLAAFLQGHVQASINAADIYAMDAANPLDLPKGDETWSSGAMNAMPYFTAALLGSPMSLPINICIGRRGALTVSAFLIIASSIGSAFCQTWLELLLVRIIAGVGTCSLVSLSNSFPVSGLTNIQQWVSKQLVHPFSPPRQQSDSGEDLLY